MYKDQSIVKGQARAFPLHTTARLPRKILISASLDVVCTFASLLLHFLSEIPSFLLSLPSLHLL